MTNRIVDHPVLGKLEERQKVQFEFDGKTYEGYENDTIASALLAHGIRTLRKHEESGNPRGIYCNIGHCFECRVTVNGETNVRACLTPIKANMIVESGQVQPHPLNPSQEGDIPKTYAEYLEQEGRG
ncbi:(2Fe-2S)-binding protein [Ornithinibacillus halotolerans]|uniref:(2Fe-2S)-binding protein n=1 Tax=Ornithinibacillus halotolerans TaxID=1274357 RepID=A0A916W7J7_9BACI|nr:(2Fe-2S)-binding protein [Ornithinibacillus halotolerans]GGA74273.1 (2Fe-2S)-binding protein [Ornithinibacillus halotolerans]